MIDFLLRNANAFTDVPKIAALRSLHSSLKTVTAPLNFLTDNVVMGGTFGFEFFDEYFFISLVLYGAMYLLCYGLFHKQLLAKKGTSPVTEDGGVVLFRSFSTSCFPPPTAAHQAGPLPGS